MSLDEIISRAIPITQHDCSIRKAQKERMRKEMKARIEEWHRLQMENRAGCLGGIATASTNNTEISV